MWSLLYLPVGGYCVMLFSKSSRSFSPSLPTAALSVTPETDWVITLLSEVQNRSFVYIIYTEGFQFGSWLFKASTHHDPQSMCNCVWMCTGVCLTVLSAVKFQCTHLWPAHSRPHQGSVYCVWGSNCTGILCVCLGVCMCQRFSLCVSNCVSQRWVVWMYTHPVVWPSPQGPGCDSGGHTLSVQLPSELRWPRESCCPGLPDSRGPLFPGESACSAAAEPDALSHLSSAKTELKCYSW